MQYQAALQLAAQAPNLYDMPLLHRQMMELIGIPNADKVVPNQEEVPPKDPVTENQDMLTLAPVKVYEYQDHEAHMRVHMALKNDPQLAQEVQNSPAGGAVSGALDSHVREHLAFVFRRQIEEELGAPLPPVGEPLPTNIERQLSVMVADAADQMMGKKQQKAQAEQMAAQQEDPIVKQRERELNIREMEVQRKQQADQAKQQFDTAKLGLDREKAEADISMDEKELAAKVSLEQQKLAADLEKFEAEQEAEGFKFGIETDKFTAQLEQKERERERKGE